jgi:hypothetical protein
MSRLRFLAAAYDPRPGKEGTVYGPGHETDFDSTDYEYALQLRNRGLAEIIDPTGLPAAPSPEIKQEPFVAPPPAA